MKKTAYSIGDFLHPQSRTSAAITGSVIGGASMTAAAYALAKLLKLSKSKQYMLMAGGGMLGALHGGVIGAATQNLQGRLEKKFSDLTAKLIAGEDAILREKDSIQSRFDELSRDLRKAKDDAKRKHGGTVLATPGHDSILDVPDRSSILDVPNRGSILEPTAQDIIKPVVDTLYNPHILF